MGVYLKEHAGLCNRCDIGDPLPVVTLPAPRLIIDDGHPDARLAPMDLLLREYRSG